MSSKDYCNVQYIVVMYQEHCFCAVDTRQVYALFPHPYLQESVKDGEGEKIRSEFAAIDEQLNHVERYAMRYLEEENAGVAAEQLKQAEVCVFGLLVLYTLASILIVYVCTCVHAWACLNNEFLSSNVCLIKACYSYVQYMYYTNVCLNI